MASFLSFFVLCSAILLIAFSSAHESKVDGDRKHITLSNSDKEQKHIVLLGASIGKGWNISLLSERINNCDYVFEYAHYSGFDKSDKLRKIVSRDENKPDVIFIKECAAYFPGDINHYKNLMKKWIEECQRKDVIPIPATVVPVTRLHSFKQFMIDIVKGRNPLRYGSPFSNKRNEALLEYNDWIRIYCKKCGLSVLDLEAAVRYSEENRYLREDLARLDGVHINKSAYKILDQIVIPTLEEVSE